MLRRGWHRRPLAPGATEAKDIFDLAARADTAFVSVPDGKATLTVARDLAAATHAGSPP